MEPVSYTPQATSEPVAPAQPEDSYKTTSSYTPLHEHFGAKSGNQETDRQLQAIWQWATEKAENKDRDSVMWEVIKLKNKLGTGSISDKPWAKLMNYVTVYNQFRTAEQRLKEIERV